MRIKLITIFLLGTLICPAQKVISSAGKSARGTSVQLSWTVGESVIKTFRGSDVILTQGFHQSWMAENQIPVADAGLDQVVSEGALVTLNGSASIDPDSDPLTFQWTAPPGIVLNSVTAVQPAFTAPDVTHDTAFTFMLIVNDGKADSNPDYTVVIVKNNDGQNHFLPVWTDNGFDHMNINVVKATIDSLDLETGDEIGLFDGELCVGAGKLTTTIDFQHLLEIKASRDDGSGNGYTAGHPVTYKFWDISAGKEIMDIKPFYYDLNPLWSTSGIYEANTSGFVELSAITYVTRTISLRNGWNIFSSDIVPFTTGLKELLQSLIDGGQLFKVQDENGNSLENYGIFGGWINNIGDIVPTEGYKIKVTGNCAFSIVGKQVILPFSIPLKAGWNIMGYPSPETVNGLDVVNDLIVAKKLYKVQDELGNAIEDYGIFGGWKNNIGNFVPGKGYKIKLTGSEVLTIKESVVKSAPVVKKPLVTSHFHLSGSGNGRDHMNINLVELPLDLLQPGDEIAVFDGDLCAGAVQLTPDNLKERTVSIPVSAYDGTPGSGFMEGDLFSLRIWKKQTNKEFPAETELISGFSCFRKHESAFVTLGKYAGTGFNDLAGNGEITAECFPNPFSKAVNIRLKLEASSVVTVEVIDHVGRLVRRLLSGTDLNPGTCNLLWDGRNGNGHYVSSGIYHLRIITGDTMLHFKILRTESKQ